MRTCPWVLDRMTDPVASASPVTPGAVPSAPAERRLRGILLHPAFWALGLALPILALSYITRLGWAFSPLLGLAAIAYPLVAHRAGITRSKWFAAVLVASSVSLAIASYVTGRYNGLTDEPYVMPYVVGSLFHGQDPYAVVRTYTYQQYGTTLSVTTGYVYLPLYLILQPFIVSYKVYTIAAWAAAVYLVRRRPFARVAIGQPFVAILAANGFNDFPVLLLLTLAYVGLNGKRQRWAELVALGCKQFANVFVIGYRLVRRDLRGAGIAAGVTVAIILPFLLWNPGAFVCETLPLTPHSCGSASAVALYAHTNYYLWPLWGLAIFFDPIAAWLRQFPRWRERGLGTAADAERTAGGSPATEAVHRTV